MRLLPVFPLLMLCACQQPAKIETEAGDTVSVGKIERIYSSILEEEREIWVYVPPAFYGMNATDESYPVVYLMDAEIQFRSTVGIFDQLNSAANATDAAPASIIVGIVNNNRTLDLTPTKAAIGADTSAVNFTGRAPMLADFVEKELIPFIESKYPVNQHRSLIGHSFGGLFVLHTLIEKPSLFRNYLVIDPSMWWDEGHFRVQVLQQLASTSYAPGQSLYLAIANNALPGMEDADIYQDSSELISLMRELLLFRDSLDLLDDTGLEVTTKYFPNERHGLVPLPATFQAFRHFYRHYSFDEVIKYYYPGHPQQRIPIQVAIKTHFDSLSKYYGYEVKPRQSYLNAYGWGLKSFQQPAAGLALMQLNAAYYPKSHMVFNNLANMYLQLGDTIPAKRALERALELKPGEERIKVILEDL